MDDSGDLRPEEVADGVEELREARVAAGFRPALDYAGDEVKLVQVIGDRVGHAGEDNSRSGVHDS